jgi:hypothetical protein
MSRFRFYVLNRRAAKMYVMVNSHLGLIRQAALRPAVLPSVGTYFTLESA